MDANPQPVPDHSNALLKILYAGVMTVVENPKMLSKCFQAILQRHDSESRDPNISKDRWASVALMAAEAARTYTRPLVPNLCSTMTLQEKLSILKDSRGVSMNNLHAAVHHRYPEVVEILLQDISQQHSGFPNLASMIISARDSNQRTALTTAIERKDARSIRSLLRRDTSLVTMPWGYPKVYPLQQLLQQAAEPAGHHDEPSLSEQQWCLILEEVVKANPVFTLTKSCAVSDDLTASLQDEVKVTGYGLIQRGLIGGGTAKSSLLEALRDKLESLIWTHLEGGDIKEAGLGSLPSPVVLNVKSWLTILL